MMQAMKLDYSDKNADLGALYPNHVEIICARHDHALEQAGAAHAVIFSGAQKYAFLDDYMTPFKDNPHFLGWAPLTNLPLSYIPKATGRRNSTCALYTMSKTPRSTCPPTSTSAY
jgi:hypothetical protein